MLEKSRLRRIKNKLDMYSVRSILEKFKNILLSITIHLNFFICKLLPIKNKTIVIDSFNGRGWGDSPKYIALEIHRRQLPYKIFWLCKDMENDFPDWVCKIPYDSFQCKRIVSQAKVILSNVKHGYPYKKKRQQYYIQLWHGDFGPKYCEKDTESQLQPWYVKLSKKDSLITDVIISGSKFFTRVAKTAFWYPSRTEVLETGIPRNDIYFHISDKLKSDLLSKYHLSKGKRYALYAPTFRDNGDLSVYNIDTENLRLALKEKTGKEWAIIIRLHPNIKDKSNLFHYDENVINGSLFSEAQELCIISNLLITDYSSIMLDFILMKKPFLLYTPDVDNYEKERGLRPIFYTMPHYATIKELADAIKYFNISSYLSWLDKFMREDYGSFDDGNASKRLVDRIKDVMDGKYGK